MKVGNIPLVVDGQLRTDAGMLVLGYMLYPKCERSAHQFNSILQDETLAEACDPNYSPGELWSSIKLEKAVTRLLLAGQLALRVCANYSRHGKAYFAQAAHVISELNATNKTVSGKSLPTDPVKLEKTFREHQASMHFWAAAAHQIPLEEGGHSFGVDTLARIQVSYEFLGSFLATARQFEEILVSAKPPEFIWSATLEADEVWNLDHFPKANLLDEPEKMQGALSSYVTRPKT